MGGWIFLSDQLEVCSGKVRNKSLNHLSVSLVLDTSDCNLFSAHSELECLEKAKKKNSFDCDSINKQILFQFMNMIYKKTIKTVLTIHGQHLECVFGGRPLFVVVSCCVSQQLFT